LFSSFEFDSLRDAHKHNNKQKKMGKMMTEFKTGTLHSGKSGPVVKSKKQAIAISLSASGLGKKKK
jgi:hypothetical protein